MRFLGYFKYYVCKFMQANSWHHQLLPFKFVISNHKRVEKKEKNTDIWIPGEQKDLFRWNKKYLNNYFIKNITDANCKFAKITLLFLFF